jgi:integrase
MNLPLPFINWNSKTAYIREPKEGKGKEIRFDLLEDLTPMLRELYDSANNKEGYVFLNKHSKKYDHATLHFILKKASAGITDLSLKDLARGTTITRLIKHYGLLEAMAQVGHSQIATTQKYVGIPSVRSIKPKVVFPTFHQTQKHEKKV